MHYTLYIDESGDFESSRGEWVVTGIFIPLKLNECEKILPTAFRALPRQLELQSIKDFHLTEFRTRFGHQAAVEMAKTTLATLDAAAPGHICLATINTSKTTVVERERTYRLMLSDLLALCETTLPDNQQLDSLSLVVASRTINGTQQTSISNITQDVLRILPEAFEVGLATRGLMGLLGNKITVSLDYANNSWGLVCADFVANLTYHRKRLATEHEFLGQLEKTGKYIPFESFGSYALRQARVAERDCDYVTALYRWLLHAPKDGATDDTGDAMRRVLGKVFAGQAVVQASATVEAVLERLWRTHRAPDKYDILSAMLKRFEDSLVMVLAEKDLPRFAYLPFRTRNMILLVDNHRGDTQSAESYAGKQREVEQELMADPELFHLVLDFKIHEIEMLVNKMELDDALQKAKNYHELIQGYKAVWELITERSAIDFARSKISIKAEMGLLRCHLLCANDSTASVQEKTILPTIAAWFKALEQAVSSPSDISRLNNYKIMYFLKNDKPEMAVSHCLQFHKNISSAPLNEFDLFWFLRAVNDDWLYKDILPKQASGLLEEAGKIAYFQIRLCQPKIESLGHPRDLLWREIALLEYHMGNKSKATKALVKSKKYSIQGSSPILKYLNGLLDKHAGYINDEIPVLELQKCPNKSQWLYDWRYGSPY